MCYFWIHDLLNNIRSIIHDVLNNAPSIMQNFGLGLIAIFIATAVLLHQKGDETTTFPWDDLIIFDVIIKPKTILISLLLIFLPLLLWRDKKYIRDSLLMILPLIGFYGLVESLNKCVKWIKSIAIADSFPEDSNIHNFRLEFIRDLIKKKNLKKIKRVWDTTWPEKIKEVDFEKELISCFFNSLTVFDKENLDERGEILITFSEYINNRNLHDSKIQKIIVGNSILFNNNLSEDEKNKWWSEYFFEMIEKIVNYSTKKGFLSSLGFHGMLTELLKKSNFVESEKEEIISKYVAPCFISNINKKNRYDFPLESEEYEWGVTIEKYENDDIFCKAYFLAFLNWLIKQFNEGVFSENVNEVISVLFPEVEPRAFLQLMCLGIYGNLFFSENNGDIFLEEIKKINKIHLVKPIAFNRLDPSKSDYEEAKNGQINSALKLFYIAMLERSANKQQILDRWKSELEKIKGILLQKTNDDGEETSDVKILDEYLDLIKKLASLCSSSLE